MAGQVWAVAADGGYMYSDELSDTLRMAVQPLQRFRQFCDAKDAMNKGYSKGDKFHWNVYKNVQTHGRALAETEKMPETKFTIVQGELTVDEFGNSVPFSSKLDNLSRHPVQEVIEKVLKQDVSKVLDEQAYLQFDATPLRASEDTSTTSFTLDEGGVALQTNAAGIKMNADMLKFMVDTMKERNIPMYDGRDYFGIAWPTTWRPLKNDLEQVFQYVESGVADIRAGEIGRYEGVRLIEQTNIQKGGAADTTIYDPLTTPDAWDNGNDWAFFFGEDTCAEALVIPEEMRGAIPSDYGRSKGVAWYYLGGFGIVHSEAAEARIIKWDSAA